MKTRTWIYGICAAALVVGCSSHDPRTETGAQSNDDKLFSETVVHLNPDGTQDVHENLLTEAEVHTRSWWLRAHPEATAGAQLGSSVAGPSRTGPEKVGSTSQAITDVSCDGNEGAIFTDGNCRVGGQNAICFSGTGEANLSTYCRGSGCTSNWAGNVQTYLAVKQGGYAEWYENHAGQCLICPFCSPSNCSQCVPCFALTLTTTCQNVPPDISIIDIYLP
jgi:hypothetical protein